MTSRSSTRGTHRAASGLERTQYLCGSDKGAGGWLPAYWRPSGGWLPALWRPPKPPQAANGEKRCEPCREENHAAVIRERISARQLRAGACCPLNTKRVPHGSAVFGNGPWPSNSTVHWGLRRSYAGCVGGRMVQNRPCRGRGQRRSAWATGVHGVPGSWIGGAPGR